MLAETKQTTDLHASSIESIEQESGLTEDERTVVRGVRVVIQSGIFKNDDRKAYLNALQILRNGTDIRLEFIEAHFASMRQALIDSLNREILKLYTAVYGQEEGGQIHKSTVIDPVNLLADALDKRSQASSDRHLRIV